MVMLNLTREESDWLFWSLVASESQGEELASKILLKIPVPKRQNKGASPEGENR